jgi:hypothetical protein
MDSLCTAAARALQAGDPVTALKHVALRRDAAALALRGIAMAQLGELARAKQLLTRALRGFEPREALARARCQLARAEVSLMLRELLPADTERALSRAQRTLEAHGDRVNAIHARLLAIRRLLLLGQIDRAERALGELALDGAPAPLVAVRELVAAEIALRRVRTVQAQRAFDRAREAAGRARIPALAAEIELGLGALKIPAARLLRRGQERPLLLAEVEALLGSKELVVDACRRTVRDAEGSLVLARRPVLFGLVRALAEAWPEDVSRESLLARVFGARRANESHRARLRVEIGRLRRELAGRATVSATPSGFVLSASSAAGVAVLAPPIDGEGAALLALLDDGKPWSTSALALALGQSQRSVQRVLSELLAASRVRRLGRARAQRWLAPPMIGFTTTLLLPASLAVG